MFNSVAVEAKGDGDLLQSVRIKNVKTSEESDLPANGLFYAIGKSKAGSGVTAEVDISLHRPRPRN